MPHDIIYVWNLNATQVNQLQNKNRSTDIEIRLVAAKGR